MGDGCSGHISLTVGKCHESKCYCRQDLSFENQILNQKLVRNG